MPIDARPPKKTTVLTRRFKVFGFASVVAAKKRDIAARVLDTERRVYATQEGRQVHPEAYQDDVSATIRDAASILGIPAYPDQLTAHSYFTRVYSLCQVGDSPV